MPGLAFPLFNGRRLSRTSTDLVVANLRIVGWKSLNIGVEKKSTKMRGNRRKPQGRTAGSIDFTCDIEINSEEAQAIKKTLGPGFMDAQFDVQLTFFDSIVGVAVSRSALGCEIMKVDDSVGDNDDAQTEKWTLDPMEVLHDGLPVVIESPF